MMLDLTIAGFLYSGTASPVPVQKPRRIIVSSVSSSETPLPSDFASTPLQQMPTQGLIAKRTIVSELGAVEAHLRAVGVLGISAEAQATVSQIITENMPRATTKRLLAPRAK